MGFGACTFTLDFVEVFTGVVVFVAPPDNAIFAALNSALLFVRGEIVGAPVEATVGRGLLAGGVAVAVFSSGDFLLFTAGDELKGLVEGGREGGLVLVGVPLAPLTVRMEAAEAGLVVVANDGR